jgi:hypothetical protein
MSDKPEPFYKPEGTEPVAAVPEKRKPGRPAKATAVAEPSAVIEPGMTADLSLAPDAAPQESETIEQAIERIRKVRQPFGGGLTQKLALPKRPGYHRHWFNDVAGRIDEASASGWTHVINPRDGKPTKRVVGSGRDNKALEAYAMELPEVFWQEEMDARHAEAAARIEGIKKNPFQAKPGQAKASDKGKFYDPTEGSGAGPLQVVKG